MTGTTEPAATGMPTDAELIRLLRRRVHRLETAVMDYCDAMEAMGRPVGAAWTVLHDAMRRGATEAGADARDAFVLAYAASLPKRRAAVEGLLASVREDFRQAVLTDPDMTDEDRAHWVALCDAEDAEGKEQEQ